MSSIILCNYNEMERLLKRQEVRNRNPYIYVLDVERKETLKGLTDQPYLAIPYETDAKVLRQYPDMPMMDISTPFGVSLSSIKSYINKNSIGEGNSVKPDTIIRSVTRNYMVIDGYIDCLYTLAKFIFEIIEDERTAIVVIDTNNSFTHDINQAQFKAFRKIMEENVLCKVPVFSPDQFLENPSACQIQKSENKKRELLSFMNDNYTFAKGRDEDLVYFCDPYMMTASDFKGRRLRDIAALCEMCGIYGVDSNGNRTINPKAYDKIKDEDLYYELYNKLYEYMTYKWHKRLSQLDIKDMNRDEIILWSRRLNIDVRMDMSTKMLRHALKETSELISKMRNNEPCKEVYENMSEYSLQKELWKYELYDINPYEDREDAIRKLLEVNGIMETDFELPTKEELKALKKYELWQIYDSKITVKKVPYSVFKGYDKKYIIELLLREFYYIKQERAFKDLFRDDIENMKPREVTELFETIPDENMKKRLLKTIENESLAIAISDFCRIYNIKYKFEVEGIKYKTEEEMKEMTKKDLVNYAEMQLNINTTFLKRKEIIKLALSAKKKHDKEIAKEEKKSDINYDNLMKLRTKDLHKICKTSGYKLDSALSKDKLVKSIIQQYYKRIDKPFEFKKEESEVDKIARKEMKRMKEKNRLGICDVLPEDINPEEIGKRFKVIDDLSDALIRSYQNEKPEKTEKEKKIDDEILNEEAEAALEARKHLDEVEEDTSESIEESKINEDGEVKEMENIREFKQERDMVVERFLMSGISLADELRRMNSYNDKKKAEQQGNRNDNRRNNRNDRRDNRDIKRRDMDNRRDNRNVRDDRFESRGVEHSDYHRSLLSGLARNL